MKESKEKSTVKLYSTEFFLFLFNLALSCVGGWMTVMLWKRLGLGDHFEPLHLALVLLLIVEYVTISLTAICLAAFFKGGFSKLKKFKERGLLFWLGLGLIVGFSLGLAIGLISWLISWFAIGLFSWLSGGIFAGLVYGLPAEFDG